MLLSTYFNTELPRQLPPLVAGFWCSVIFQFEWNCCEYLPTSCPFFNNCNDSPNVLRNIMLCPRGAEMLDNAMIPPLLLICDHDHVTCLFSLAAPDPQICIGQQTVHSWNISEV